MLAYLMVLVGLLKIYNVSCDPLDKVDPGLRLLIEDKVEINVLVWFGDSKLGLARAEGAMRKTITNPKAIVTQAVFEALKDFSDKQQFGVVQMLSNSSDEIISSYNFERLWITNRIFIKEADIFVIKRVASDINVTRISQEVVFDMDKNVFKDELKGFENATKRKFTWGLERIQVPETWELLGGPEKAGKGVVVGIMDTGCVVDHESIRENFLGEYGWFDAVYSVKEPDDMRGHGSHVTGTIVGKNGIGVVPAAKHAQCRVCDKYCTEKNFDRCAQFFVCPTLPDGSKENCSKRVDIVNISFGFEILPKFNDIISVLRTAGIIPVAPAGNNGPNCSSIRFPSETKNDVITVGNTDIKDKVDEHSSRGPLAETGYKPDVCAPGTKILSVNFEDLPNVLKEKSGTSMATAHVTGLVVLLLGKDKKLGMEKIRNLIIENTDQNLTTSGDTCGGILDSNYPNDFCGYGRINALKTVKALGKVSTG